MLKTEHTSFTAEHPLHQTGGSGLVWFFTFERNGRSLHLAPTECFYRTCRKGNVWQSHAFLTAIKNAEYGFDPHLARSHGGCDSIFLLDRSYMPKNAMMTKLFDRYLDMPDRGAEHIAKALRTEVEHLQAARLVSHHQISQNQVDCQRREFAICSDQPELLLDK